MTSQQLADLIDAHRSYRTYSGWFSCYGCAESWRDHDGFAAHLAALIEAEFRQEPVGFIVLAKRASDVTPGKTNYRTPSPIFHRDDRGVAEYSLRGFRDGLVDAERMWHGQCEYVLGEVREVR